MSEIKSFGSPRGAARAPLAPPSKSADPTPDSTPTAKVDGFESERAPSAVARLAATIAAGAVVSAPAVATGALIGLPFGAAPVGAAVGAGVALFSLLVSERSPSTTQRE